MIGNCDFCIYQTYYYGKEECLLKEDFEEQYFPEDIVQEISVRSSLKKKIRDYICGGT